MTRTVSATRLGRTERSRTVSATRLGRTERDSDTPGFHPNPGTARGDRRPRRSLRHPAAGTHHARAWTIPSAIAAVTECCSNQHPIQKNHEWEAYRTVRPHH
eukprot:751592-Hanusia_phi.AAC.2